MTNGAPASAALLLARALTEPPDGHVRPTLGLELGRSLTMSGDLQAATTALQVALELVDEPVARAPIALELGRALRLTGQIPEAVRVLDQAAASLPPGHHDEEIALEAEIALASHMGLPAKEWIDRLAAVVERSQGTSLADRSVRAMYGFVAAATGTEDATEAARISRSGLPPADEMNDPPFLYQAAAAGLAMCGSFTEGLRVLDRALEISQQLGDAVQFGFISATRTWVAHRAGRVLEAEADARAILAVPAIHTLYGTYAVAHVIVALIERGALDEAEALLKEHDLPETTELGGLLNGPFYAIRARLHRVCGRPREALADTARCRAALEEVGFTGPAYGEWRMEGALSHLALGERTLAREVADEDLELSRRFGAPRELGIALRVRGLVEGGTDGLTLLAESVDVLAGSEAVLDHAKSLVEHGSALRRAGNRSEACDQLRRGLDLASQCGATALVTRAHDELTVAGARPRRERLNGPDSLTASELRVARLAAEGRSNPEIAQALFVTRRTVEVHLTQVYRKLGIDSRDQLPSALTPADEPPSPRD